MTVLTMIVAAMVYATREERVIAYESMYAGCMCGSGYYYIVDQIIWEINPNHDTKKMFAKIIDDNQGVMQYSLWDDGAGFHPEGQGLLTYNQYVIMFDDEEAGKAVKLRESRIARMLNFDNTTIREK